MSDYFLFVEFVKKFLIANCKFVMRIYFLSDGLLFIVSSSNWIGGLQIKCCDWLIRESLLFNCQCPTIVYNRITHHYLIVDVSVLHVIVMFELVNVMLSVSFYYCVACVKKFIVCLKWWSFVIVEWIIYCCWIFDWSEVKK